MDNERICSKKRQKYSNKKRSLKTDSLPNPCHWVGWSQALIKGVLRNQGFRGSPLRVVDQVINYQSLLPVLCHLVFLKKFEIFVFFAEKIRNGSVERTMSCERNRVIRTGFWTENGPNSRGSNCWALVFPKNAELTNSPGSTKTHPVSLRFSFLPLFQFRAFCERIALWDRLITGN